MTVLITGASGFIGQRLVAAAVAAWGAEQVVALSSRPVAGCRSIVYRSLALELAPSDLDTIATVQVLIHAGAYTPKNGAQAHDVVACNGNISFTERLLALPLPALRKVVLLSTLDVYAEATPISEHTATAPATLYGASKLYCEQMVCTWAQQHGCAAQVLRIGHVYGPGEEKYAKFLPKAVQAIVAGQPVELWGDGAELRSFIYIDDVIQATLAAVQLQATPGVINVVGGRAISIRQLLDLLVRLSGRTVDVQPRSYTGAKRDFIFDTTRLKAHLLPHETDLETGLRAELAHVESLL
jgi:UDP-glucose 4-epimerase